MSDVATVFLSDGNQVGLSESIDKFSARWARAIEVGHRFIDVNDHEGIRTAINLDHIVKASADD